MYKLWYTHTAYRVYQTLEEAWKVAEEIFQQTGVVVAITQ